jgi:membrane protease YdiL (CAAX protease family)
VGVPAAPAFSTSRLRLAVIVCASVLLLYITVGVAAQIMNLGVGLWFTEVFIFLGLPWVAMRLSGRDPLSYVGLRAPPLAATAYGFALGAANFFALVIPLQFLSQSLVPESWLVDPSLIFRNRTTAEMVLIISGVSIAAPVCEEVMFRGVLQQGLRLRGATITVSLVLTSLIFSGFHGDLVGFLARFELGVLFGFLFWRTGSLWPAIAAHSANNVVSTVLYFVTKPSLEALEAAKQNVEVTGVLATSLLGMVFLAPLAWAGVQYPSLLQANRPAEEVPDPHRVRSAWQASLPWITGAAASIALLLAFDFRGVRLNVYDLRHPLKGKHEALEDLRKKARRGEVPLEEYLQQRAELSRQRKR